MEGLSESLNHSLQGKEADQITRRIRAQIKEWGLALPEVEPLVLDFGLGRFEEIGETEFWIANEVGGGYCGKFMFLFKGQTKTETHENHTACSINPSNHRRPGT